MTLLVVLLLALCRVYNYVISSVLVANPFTGEIWSPDSISEYKKLEALVNSLENRKLFSQLANGENCFYDIESNVLGTIKLHNNRFQTQPYVSNGFIGSRIPNLGHGFACDELETGVDEKQLSNGWPLYNRRFSGAFMAGFYDIQNSTKGTNFGELLDNGYESVIAAIPQWTTLRLSTTVNDSTYILEPGNEYGDISHYVQKVSLSNGMVETEYTWLGSLIVKYTVLAHRKDISLGVVTLDIYNVNHTQLVLVENVLDFNTSERCQLVDVGYDNDGIYMNFQPNEVNYVNGSIYSYLETNVTAEITRAKSSRSVSEKIRVDFVPQSHVSFIKRVGVVSNDLVEGDTLTAAKEVALKYKHDSHLMISSHKHSWSKILATLSVTFPDDRLLTLTSRASVFHLAANTRSNANGNTGALGVGGLSSDSYGGMVFWDSDLWMLNGLLPFVPDHAQSIVNYRREMYAQAKKNVPPNYSGAVYPWTSGRFGNCTATGPCMDYEYHINMAVAFSALQIYLSGYGDDDYLRQVAPLIYDAADFMASYVSYNTTLGKYTSLNLTDPDEFANHVDNGAYTNAATSLLMKYAIAVSAHLNDPVSEKWPGIGNNMYLPKSNGVVLEYSGMNSSVAVKQADVVMLTYPLENELITTKEALANINFYSMKQVSYGPAMTFPIFSIVSAKLAQSGCTGESYLYKSVIPFLRAPFAQFLEQNNDNYIANGGTNPAFPFLTAHGGFLQAILNGLMGLKFDYRLNNTQIIRTLKLDPIKLAFLPHGVVFHGVKYFNQTLLFNLSSNHLLLHHTGTSVHHESRDLDITIGQRNPMSGTYKLKPGEHLQIPLYESPASHRGTLSECGLATFINITESVDGDTTYLINDGDNFTHWQLRHGSAKILVDLQTTKNITRGEFNWGDRPPERWTLSAFKLDHDWNYHQILASIDFGTDVHRKYRFFRAGGVVSQNEAFTRIIGQKVNISAPFDGSNSARVEVPTHFNTSAFDYPGGIVTRYLLLELQGVHDGDGGAKVYGVLFF